MELLIFGFVFFTLLFGGLIVGTGMITSRKAKDQQPYPYVLKNQNDALVARLEKQTRKYERDLSRYRRIIFEERRRNGTLGAKGAGGAGSGSPQVRGTDEPETADGDR